VGAGAQAARTEASLGGKLPLFTALLRETVRKGLEEHLKPLFWWFILAK